MTADAPFVERAAAWAAGLDPSAVPPAVQRAACAQLQSTVGAALWSLEHPVGERVAGVVAREFGDGDATFLGGQATTPRGAVYGNAALSMALDFDDTVLGGHTGHSAALVPLAYAEATGASGERALLAHVAANEVAARLASAAAVGPFRGQQTAYVHAAGAAVARGVVAGDDAATLADALAVALGQPPWPLSASFLGSDGKLFSAAEPALSGLSAVSAAREGLAGNRRLVEDDEGFLASFADRPLPAFLGDLGERWHTRAVTVKDTPGCAYVTAPVRAALDARERLAGRGRPARIDRVNVYGSLFTVRVDELAGEYLDGPESPLAALSFSVPYNVAVALSDGAHGPAQLHPDRVADESVWALADRVSVCHDPEYTLRALRSEVPLGAMLRRVGPGVVPYAAKSVGVGTALRNLPTLLRFVRRRPIPDDLSGATKEMGARVELRLDDGTRLSVACDHPPGFAGHPLDEIRAVAREKCEAALRARGAGADAPALAAELDAVADAPRVDLAPFAEVGA